MVSKNTPNTGFVALCIKAKIKRRASLPATLACFKEKLALIKIPFMEAQLAARRPLMTGFVVRVIMEGIRYVAIPTPPKASPERKWWFPF
jgi:hypothetical protein